MSFVVDGFLKAITTKDTKVHERNQVSAPEIIARVIHVTATAPFPKAITTKDTKVHEGILVFRTGPALPLAFLSCRKRIQQSDEAQGVGGENWRECHG